MTAEDKITYLVIGGLIGFVFGYIVRALRSIERKVDHVDHKVPEKGEDGRAPYWLNFRNTVLMLVVVLVAFSAFRADQALSAVQDNLETNKLATCQGGVENRQVQRELVEAIYNLALGSIDESQIKNLTAKELGQYNAYIERVNNFRTDMYSKIKPSDACVDYVTDDRILPPTDPFPSIQAPKPKK